MIFIRNEVLVRGAIGQGSVYRFSPGQGISHHYYIVMNKTPKEDAELYLASFTSKKQDVYRFIDHHGFDVKTCVEVENSECPFLSKPKESCINCNRVRKYDIEKLIELIDSSDGSCHYPKIPESLLIKIIEGIKLSKMVGKDVKDRL